MLQISVVLQDASTGRASALINKLAELGSSAQFQRLRAAVAYASFSGCRDLVGRFERSIDNWDRLHKRWLVSIDFGRTEVQALEHLQTLMNSEVRIPDAEELLRNGLIPHRCFHPKTYVFDSGVNAAHAPYAILVGSGNLTLSGLHAGVEHATSLLWLDPLEPNETERLRSVQTQLVWWEAAWGKAVPLTAALLAQYRRIRPRRPREDTTFAVRSFATAERREIDADPGISWSFARCFWIETLELYKNRGRGRPGNQVDLRRGTRVYFGFSADAVPRNTVLGSITLQYEDRVPRARSVRFGNNSMDKVNLPIPGEDGPESYDNSVVHFERVGPKRFRVSLGDEEDLNSWRETSRRQEMLYELAGGRGFGFYD